jgi:hypothetical protein
MKCHRYITEKLLRGANDWRRKSSNVTPVFFRGLAYDAWAPGSHPVKGLCSAPGRDKVETTRFEHCGFRLIHQSIRELNRQPACF